jgi:heat shock protein HtpX
MLGPRARTALVFAALIAVFVVAGGILGAWLTGSVWVGLLLALGLALVLNLASYFFCDRFVLWSTHARLVQEADAPRLYRTVHELAPLFGLTAPRVAIIPTPSLNALATGRDAKHAVVAATQGLLSACDDRQLRAVLAHEMAHVKDRDVLLMTFAATLAGAVSYAAEMVLFTSVLGGGGRQQNVNPVLLIAAAITAPIAAMLLQLAVSRSRELRADEVGARTIGDPAALASALETLERANDRRPMRFGSPATSSLFIVNPFRGSTFANLFSTHPPLKVRIARLRAMEAGTPLAGGTPSTRRGRRGATVEGSPL